MEGHEALGFMEGLSYIDDLPAVSAPPVGVAEVEHKAGVVEVKIVVRPGSHAHTLT